MMEEVIKRKVFKVYKGWQRKLKDLRIFWFGRNREIWLLGFIISLETVKIDYAFRDQIQRAAVSVMNNIAEGYERKGNREFAKFLYIAKGSSAEVRSMLCVAPDLNYISQNDFDIYFQKSEQISRMLSSFIKRLN